MKELRHILGIFVASVCMMVIGIMTAFLMIIGFHPGHEPDVLPWWAIGANHFGFYIHQIYRLPFLVVTHLADIPFSALTTGFYKITFILCGIFWGTVVYGMILAFSGWKRKRRKPSLESA